jgi:hypothetical protein
MILRSLTKHVNNQNWFAVFLDFIIVVFGVFVGIQVANWNEAQTLHNKETQLLIELKTEIEKGVAISNHKSDGYSQVAAAGKRSLAVLLNEGKCETDCWLALVDFMHASQWQDVRINHSIYDEIRRLGLPQNRTIIEKVEGYIAQNENSALALDDRPLYRSRIRQLIPVDVQEYYWSNCYTLERGAETYLLNCPVGLSNEKAAQVIKSIVNHPYIKLQLTEWSGYVVQIPSDFNQQNDEALEAIALIDAELERR